MKNLWIQWMILLLIIGISCQKSSVPRKIRLSDNSQTITRTDDRLTTTIHLEPSQKLNIAVMFFKNQTGDENLQWLQQGLSEMFIRALSQSHNLYVLGQDRLIEILERVNKTVNQPVDMEMAAIVAKEANVEVLLRGNISKEGESLKLNIQLVEPFQGLVLRDESIEGGGLEAILSMVDQLSQKIQNELQFSLDRNESLKGIAEVSTDSVEAWQHYTIGDELCAQLLEQDAIPHYKKAIEIDPSFVSPYLKLRQCYAGLGDIETAYALYQKAEKLKHRATKHEQFMLDLTRAVMNGEIGRMLEIQQTWIQENPTDVQAKYDLATFYFGLRNYDKAIDYYEKTVQLDPKFKLALNQLGYSYALTGDYQKAIATLEKYRETVPDEPNPYDSLGEIYLFKGEYKKAVKYFRMALDKNASFSHAWAHLANTETDAGNYKKAIQCFEQSIDYQAKGIQKANTLSQIANLYYRMDKPVEALSLYQDAQDENIYQYTTPLTAADIYQQQGDTSQATRFLKDYYHHVKSNLDTDIKKRNYFGVLVHLSLWQDIEPELTLQLIDSILTDIDNPIQMLQAQFSKVLLLIKLDRTNEIDQVMQENIQQHFLTSMQNFKNIGYTNIWNYFHILNDWFVESPENGIAFYARFIEATHQLHLKFFETAFRGLLTDLAMRSGYNLLAEKQVIETGMPIDSLWWIIGPFDNKDGFNRKYPPEKEIDLTKSFRFGKNKIEWKKLDDGYFDGYVDLKHQFDQSDWAVAYAAIYIDSPDEKQIQFRTGSNEAIKIWLNDQEVWRLNRIQDAIIDDQITAVTLLPGRNKVLIKICNRNADWGFYFRVTDMDGNGIQDIRFIGADKAAGLIS